MLLRNRSFPADKHKEIVKIVTQLSSTHHQSDLCMPKKAPVLLNITKYPKLVCKNTGTDHEPCWHTMGERATLYSG